MVFDDDSPRLKGIMTRKEPDGACAAEVAQAPSPRLAALAEQYPVEAVVRGRLCSCSTGEEMMRSGSSWSNSGQFLEETRPRAWGQPSGGASEPLEMALASVAHEIRGPLLAAKAAVERSLVVSDAYVARRLLERAVEELGDLAGVILGLLRWSSGVDGVVFEATPIVEVLRDASRVGAAEGGGERLTITSDDSVAMVDRKLLVAAIANLIRNALAYSADGSDVTISGRSAGDAVAVTVSDSGPGIPLAERERVFAPFVRGRSATAKPGTGLGLFITRKIVDVHGGRILMKTGSGGTEMTVHVPKGGEVK